MSEVTRRKEIKRILERIQKEDVYENGFSQDKNAIDIIFEKTSSDDRSGILAR